jgi:hypothetical protein
VGVDSTAVEEQYCCGDQREHQQVLQHLQPLPVRHFHHGQRGRPARRTFGTRQIFIPTSPTELWPPFLLLNPAGLVDGHPSSSKLDLFEGFTQKIVDAVQANPSRWKDTAIFFTFDEGGGYYDSGTFSRSTSSATARAFQ